MNDYNYCITQTFGGEFNGRWEYEIFNDEMMIESTHTFVTKIDADIAAKRHISTLESCEG